MARTKDIDKDSITWWSNPDHKLQSQYGHVTYRQWCIAEAQRMTAKGNPCTVSTDEKTGKIAVSRACRLHKL